VTKIVTEYAKASSFVSCRNLDGGGHGGKQRAQRVDLTRKTQRSRSSDSEKRLPEDAMKKINQGIKRQPRNSVVGTDMPGFIPRGM
jgi:hypothetical protein